MALEPVKNGSFISSDSVQTGKYTGVQQQDISTTSQLVGNNQISDVAAVFNGDGENSSDDLLSRKENSQQWIKNAVTDANNKIKPTRTKCEFTYNDELNRVAIKVLNSETEEVIREIPPEETLKVLEKIWEIAGLVVDERR